MLCWIDQQRLTQNLMSAAEVYIQRCNHAPCGDTEIKLYIGAIFRAAKEAKNVAEISKGFPERKEK